jgi:transcriptional regulator with XRE-family HTH domain
MDGESLRIERLISRLRQADVARELSVSARRVSMIESLARVRPQTKERVRAAIVKAAARRLEEREL